MNNPDIYTDYVETRPDCDCGDCEHRISKTCVMKRQEDGCEYWAKAIKPLERLTKRINDVKPT